MQNQRETKENVKKTQINILVAAVCVTGILASAIARRDFGQVGSGLASGAMMWVLLSITNRFFIANRSYQSPCLYYVVHWLVGFLAILTYFALAPSLYPNLLGVKLLFSIFGSIAILLSGYLTTKSKGTTILPWKREAEKKSQGR